MTPGARERSALAATALAAAVLLGAAVPVAAYAHFSARAESGGLSVGTLALPAPADLAVSTCSEKGPTMALTVTWTGSGAARAYVVEHRPAGTTAWQPGGTVDAPTTSRSLELDKKVGHQVRVTAVVSSWSTRSAVLEAPGC